MDDPVRLAALPHDGLDEFCEGRRGDPWDACPRAAWLFVLLAEPERAERRKREPCFEAAIACVRLAAEERDTDPRATAALLTVEQWLARKVGAHDCHRAKAQSNDVALDLKDERDLDLRAAQNVPDVQLAEASSELAYAAVCWDSGNAPAAASFLARAANRAALALALEAGGCDLERLDAAHARLADLVRERLA